VTIEIEDDDNDEGYSNEGSDDEGYGDKERGDIHDNDLNNWDNSPHNLQESHALHAPWSRI
jgi:hypothetical protein